MYFPNWASKIYDAATQIETQERHVSMDIDTKSPPLQYTARDPRRGGARGAAERTEEITALAMAGDLQMLSVGSVLQSAKTGVHILLR